MKRAARVILIFILIFWIAVIIVGCSTKPQPKAYVCIEKSPLKITYIDYHKEITPETVTSMVNQAKSFKYQREHMNHKNEILIDYNSHVSSKVSDEFQKTIGVSKQNATCNN